MQRSKELYNDSSKSRGDTRPKDSIKYRKIKGEGIKN